MNRVVTVHRLTAETQVRLQATLCGICGGKSNIETEISKITSIFLRLFHQCAILIFIYILLSPGRTLGTSQKATLFRKWGNNGYKSTFTWSFKVTRFGVTFTKIEKIETILLRPLHQDGMKNREVSRILAQGVSRRCLTTEDRDRSWACQCEIYGGGCGWDIFIPRHFYFSLTESFHQCSILIFTYVLLLPNRQKAKTWET